MTATVPVVISVVQLSDTHFAEDGHRSHRGFGYDTDAAFAAVSERAFNSGEAVPDFAVVTGDIADHGTPEQYVKARAHLETIPAPVYTTPGNHDFQVPLDDGLAESRISTERSVMIDNWLFLFVDSNHDGKRLNDRGDYVDSENRVREASGMLGPIERAWLDDEITRSTAKHVWLWIHHPPSLSRSTSGPRPYDIELSELFDAHDRIRGLGAGHVHTDAVREFANRQVHVCPALTINLDYETFTLLPPGFRRYTFAEDGTVASRCELIDGTTWPRHKIPDMGIRYIIGDQGWKELVKKRTAQSQ